MPSPENRLTNPGFNTDLIGWTPTGSKVLWNNNDTEGCLGSGSVELTIDPMTGTAGIFQCVTGAFGGQDYVLGFRYKFTSLGFINCFGSFYSDDACQKVTGAGVLTAQASMPPDGAWTSVSNRHLAPSDTRSVAISCRWQPEDTLRSAYMDQMYLRVGSQGF